MEDILYTIDELASILKLHPKTILRFVHEGKIKARKIGKSWRISQNALKEYAHAELATPSRSKEHVSFDSLIDRMRVSAVIEIDEKNSEEASRLSNTLLAMLNCKDPDWGEVRYDYFYYPEIKKAKYVLFGTPGFIGEVMMMFSRIASEERRV